jgi:transposase
MVAPLIEPMLIARAAIAEQAKAMTDRLTQVAEQDPICRRLMTAPGVGPLTALEYRATIDDPARFARSRTVGAHLGLTPRSFDSAEVRRHGRITCWGDASTRAALFMAARSVLFRMTRPCTLRTWGLGVVASRGKNKGTIAVARRLAVILHRMWIEETDYRWEVLGG